jgi:hypothetical protein
MAGIAGAANQSTPLLTLRWAFSAKRAYVVVTDGEPDGFAEFRVAA